MNTETDIISKREQKINRKREMKKVNQMEKQS